MRLIFALVCAFLLFACSSGEGEAWNGPANPSPASSAPADCRALVDAICLRLSDCGAILGENVGAGNCHSEVAPSFNCERATARGRNYLACERAILVYDCRTMTVNRSYWIPVDCDGSIVGGEP
jgi:hypothetical protein